MRKRSQRQQRKVGGKALQKWENGHGGEFQKTEGMDLRVLKRSYLTLRNSSILDQNIPYTLQLSDHEFCGT